MCELAEETSKEEKRKGSWIMYQSWGQIMRVLIQGDGEVDDARGNIYSLLVYVPYLWLQRAPTLRRFQGDSTYVHTWIC